LVAYAKGVAPVKTAVDQFLAATGLTATALHSTLGRVAARALETQVVADAMDRWVGQLQAGQPVSTTGTIPAKGMGMGLSTTWSLFCPLGSDVIF
jgi:[NiFe] hydrogenase large subunit